MNSIDFIDSQINEKTLRHAATTVESKLILIQEDVGVARSMLRHIRKIQLFSKRMIIHLSVRPLKDIYNFFLKMTTAAKIYL